MTNLLQRIGDAVTAVNFSLYEGFIFDMDGTL
ncbi:TPA: carotenoid dehydrogenase, partial [Vibrio cholerae]